MSIDKEIFYSRSYPEGIVILLDLESKNLEHLFENNIKTIICKNVWLLPNEAKQVVIYCSWMPDSREY